MECYKMLLVMTVMTDMTVNLLVIVDDCGKIRLPGLSSCIKDHPEYGSINMSMCKRSITNGLT